jgi:hypothetical protein
MARRQGLFPASIANDPWVVYHGTSAANASAIESAGFRRQEPLPAAELRRLIEIYRQLDWPGLHHGGIALLKSMYKKRTTARERREGPIYFAESSWRALRYATSDLAGGEKMSGLRNAIEDLRTFIATPKIRKAHSSLSVHHIRRELDALTGLASLGEHPLRNFPGGVIYAIKFGRKDLSFLKMTGRMGIQAMQPVSSSRIVAKVLVPKEFHQEFWTEDSQRLSFYIAPDGLGSRLLRNAAMDEFNRGDLPPCAHHASYLGRFFPLAFSS